MLFIGVEVEQETSAPPPKKILDPPLCGLCWKLPDHAQSFVFCSQIMTE